MTVCLENPREPMTKLTQKKKNQKVAGCKINIQKPIALIYTSSNQIEVLMMQGNPIYNRNKDDKVLTSNLTGNVQNK